MILLDTNAVLWMLTHHARARPLAGTKARLYLSPVTVLELKFLTEVGKLSTTPGKSVTDVAEDPRWTLDSPASAALFEEALDLDWTRDPFDRLLVAHAQLRRWRLATGDRMMLTHLRQDAVLAL